ncbi:3-oxoacyl-ACP reductase FabG [Anaerosalibacter massiliensis]|uniref:3-oxoacyl-ACP reductase FabG n=1 Tax=Anaerosalibacter massiliensis TaxID=1347392 RepID=A0A9X2MH34_9FIRM|nr:3-oxoacyl-ACP reductase FabG [Anaerosalibacter massiliensis]MCR2043923.1 3-oxoacyl-ACP reductase FabG [Anaerosalibacter massiliensis]
MAKRMEDKVVIITGGAKGIGKGISNVFAKEGGKILIVVRSEETAKKAVEEIKEKGGEASYFIGDVSKEKDMNKMAETCIERYGKIDVLCHNAGIFPEKRLEDMTIEDWDLVNNINLRGTFLTVKACLPYMKKQKYGRIVITSSITGNKVGNPGLTHYAASKGGVNGFIKSAAIELAKDNITVNGVEPGNIMTEGMSSQLGEEYIKAQEASIPMGKLGEPEDIGYATLFLASDEAKYITGQTITVDGGQILPESKFDVN